MSNYHHHELWNNLQFANSESNIWLRKKRFFLFFFLNSLLHTRRLIYFFVIINEIIMSLSLCVQPTYLPGNCIFSNFVQKYNNNNNNKNEKKFSFWKFYGKNINGQIQLCKLVNNISMAKYVNLAKIFFFFFFWSYITLSIYGDFSTIYIILVKFHYTVCWLSVVAAAASIGAVIWPCP